ncbi:MAG: DNA recombination protein RmuC [Eubacteriales bacterium]|nr:DNA recombination protein RmuC [Eubacteriales bacterium]
MNNNLLGIIVVAVAIVIIFIIAVIVLNKSMQRLEKNICLNQKYNADVQNMSIANQNERLSELNRQLTDTMAQVSRSLGEMQNLHSGVEDLRRLMTNVKTRGVMGELQLGAILEEMLAPGQYDENVAVKGGSERVEFAVKFPAEDGSFVYLPIDSKFPGEAYLNLLDAYDTGDRDIIKRASDGLKNAIIKAARDIKTKYVYPPLTTDYAIMFLPFEGLYAEVLRLNMVEILQREYKINVAGPTTMAAMLNSFQLGFKSLALQQSSGEVWNTLEKVKTEFGKFNDALVKVQNRIDQVQNDLETLVGTRTRGIQRVLDKVSVISEENDDSDEEKIL